MSNELFKAVGKEITDDYKDELGLIIDEVPTEYCVIDGRPKDEFHYGISFTGSCEIEIEKVVLYADDDGNYFRYAVLQARNVEVDRLIWDKTEKVFSHI